jgi:hypothetical protein
VVEDFEVDFRGKECEVGWGRGSVSCGADEALWALLEFKEVAHYDLVAEETSPRLLYLICLLP